MPSHSAPLSDKLDISGKMQEHVKASNQEGNDIPPPPPASLANTNDSYTLSSPPVPPSSVITAPIATPTSTRTKVESNRPDHAAQNGQKSTVKFQNTGQKIALPKLALQVQHVAERILLKMLTIL